MTAGLYRGWADQIDRAGVAAWLNNLRKVGPPPILSEVPGYPPEPDIPDDLLPAVLRGVAASDLPDPDALAGLPHPALILAWDTDPSHPPATAARLAETLPNARLEIAHTLPEVRAWGQRAAQFLTESTRADVSPELLRSESWNRRSSGASSKVLAPRWAAIPNASRRCSFAAFAG